MSQGRVLAEIVAGEAMEIEEVVPGAAGLLLRFEGTGERRGGGGGLGHVAGELGDFANVVEIFGGGIRGGLGGKLAADPILGEGRETRGGDAEGACLLGDGERLEQALKGAGERQAMAMEKRDEIGGGAGALAPEGLAEGLALALEIAVKAGGGSELLVEALVEGSGLKRGGVFEQITGDVEIANLPGGAAELAEELDGSGAMAGGAVLGEEVEDGELGLDGAGGGAEEMDGLLFRVGEGEGDGGLEHRDLLPKDLEGPGGLGRCAHSGWRRSVQGVAGGVGRIWVGWLEALNDGAVRVCVASLRRERRNAGILPLRSG